MLVLRRFSISCLLATLPALAPVAEAQAAGDGRFEVTSAAVADLLQHAGLAVSAQQVRLPSGLSANTKPDLQITGAEALPDGRLRVRVSCGSGRACIPFLGTVNLQGSSALSAAAALNSSVHPESPINASSLPLLRVGEHTMLLMEDDHMRILIPVLSIDSGGVGTEVRVSSLDRKQMFRGTVVSSYVVKGRLP